MTSFHDYVAMRLARSSDQEMAMRYLRDAGYTLIEAIVWYRAAYAVSLGEAKWVVASRDIFDDQLERELAIIEAIDELGGNENDWRIDVGRSGKGDCVRVRHIPSGQMVERVGLEGLPVSVHVKRIIRDMMGKGPGED